MTPEDAKSHYPVAVRGVVVSSTKIAGGEETPNSAFLRGAQEVKMTVSHSRGVEGENVVFTEALTIYDPTSRFREGGDYVVFLEQPEWGGYRFPVCGYAFSPSQSGVEWDEVRQVMGW